MPSAAGTASQVIVSPFGPLRLTAGAHGLLCAEFVRSRKSVSITGSDPGARKHLLAAIASAERYFRGELTALESFRALDLQGTDFQQQVWRALRRIPAGKTATYGEIARQIGAPGAARAVGSACNRNPLGLFIPCHRVLGANRKLTGYAWGLARKAALLAHEGAAEGTR